MSFDVKRLLKPELNVGLKDQKIRYAVGIGALLISVFLANIPLAIIGGVLVASAKLRWCPAYSGFGKTTVRPGEESLPANPSAENH